jgi:hypothetical protein
MTTIPQSRILTSEADFIAAEREIAVIKPKREPDRAPRDNERIDELSAGIMESPPPTVAACAVKLRLLADPDLGIEANPGECESLHQIVAFLAGLQSAGGDGVPARSSAPISAAAGAGLTLEDELLKIEGVANCLEAIVGDNAGSNEYRYLAHRLQDHFHAAYRAFEELASPRAGGAA